MGRKPTSQTENKLKTERNCFKFHLNYNRIIGNNQSKALIYINSVEF